jgi:phosphohistidine swiveling domain-containing protein
VIVGFFVSICIDTVQTRLHDLVYGGSGRGAAGGYPQGVRGVARIGLAVRTLRTAKVEQEEQVVSTRPPERASVHPRPSGPVLGPGPVAETFPDPLTRLEQDLWVPPLRDGIAGALALVRTVSRRHLRRSPVVTVIRDRVVADLGLLGPRPERRGVLARLDPRPPARRLAAAWRVGRLKIAFEALAADLVERTDAELGAIPALAHLEDITLLRAIDRTGLLLRALHAHEVLAGLLVETGDTTAASAALRALARARAEGLTDTEAVARAPVILALVPPAIGAAHTLPPVPAGLADTADGRHDGRGAALDATELREALRLRARWVQEIGARIALELGARATQRGNLPHPASVRHVSLTELHAIVLGDLVMLDPEARAQPAGGEPLPARFRLTADGHPVAEAPPHRSEGHLGNGVAPGRGVGPVHIGGGDWPPDGAVLVVPALDPRLATFLPGLAAVVSETGTEMSHVAIVARELGVPVVVGIHDAAKRFEAGTVLDVDGDTGAVLVAEGVQS